MTKNIVLIGLMGAGKSTVARELAKRLGRELVVIDRLIEEKVGKKIVQIFEESSEARFRELERQAVIELAPRSGLIIDCGGGIVLNADNITDLKKNGTVFYLTANADVLYGRIKHHKHRPLMNVPKPLEAIKALIAEREELYRQAADHAIDASGVSIEPVCREILEIMKKT